VGVETTDGESSERRSGSTEIADHRLLLKHRRLLLKLHLLQIRLLMMNILLLKMLRLMFIQRL
jgi:hypothetical protein